MERFTRSFSTSTVDINKGWRNKIYDEKFYGSPDRRKDMKTATFGETRNGRFWKIKKLFHLDGTSKEEKGEEEYPVGMTTPKKNKPKPRASSKMAGSRDAFETRLMSEIYKNMSASHELASVYN